jgi:hypothetical protein
MKNYSLPYFGGLDPNNLEEYYDVDIDLVGKKIQLDLNFENKKINTKLLDTVKHFIDNISDFDSINRQHIKQDYENGDYDTAREYVEYCIDECSKDELSDFIDFDNNAVSPEVQLINSLQLVRIGFYPDSEESFATFDYSISPEITDQLIVILTHSTGVMNYMTIES